MKVQRSACLALALLSAVPIAAAEPVQGTPVPAIELWNGLTTATTKAELKAFRDRLPDKRVELVPGCTAPLGYRFVKDRLVSITFMGLDKSAPCFDLFLRDLVARYGEPEAGSVTFGGFPIATSTSVSVRTSYGTSNIWRNGGRRILLIKTPGGTTGYNLIFTVRPDKFLY